MCNYRLRIQLIFASLVLVSGPIYAQQKSTQGSVAYENITAKPIPVEQGPKTILGQDFKYPTGTPLIKAFDITIPPGKQTSLHSHAIPLYAYVISGELEVDYGSKGKRTFKAGTSYIEAIHWCHIGKSMGGKPVRIIGVYLGQENPDQIAPTDCKKAD
jgi:quercetin dioxygenase-like cupin family protein